MSRRADINRFNTYDEVRGAVLDALNIAEDKQIPDKYRLRAFDKAFDSLIAGQAVFEQIGPGILGMAVPKRR